MNTAAVLWLSPRQRPLPRRHCPHRRHCDRAARHDLRDRGGADPVPARPALVAARKSILALFGFIVLESLKIVLYGRMMAGLDDALGHHERQRGRRAEAGAA